MESAARFFLVRQSEVQQWLEITLNRKLPTSDLFASLRDGKLLCQLANTIKPGVILKVHLRNDPYSMMCNIQHFIGAAIALGVKKSSMFEVSDLFDRVDMFKVVDSLHTFATLAAKAGKATPIGTSGLNKRISRGDVLATISLLKEQQERQNLLEETQQVLLC